MSDVKYDDVKKLIENFQDLHKNMHYLLNEKTKQFDLSASQVRLLMIVKKHQNINQNSLAKKLNVTKATLSVRLQRLEKMGYLTKKHDIHDKRNYILNITDMGDTFINEGMEILQEKMLNLFKGVSKEQISQLNDVINIIKLNIEEYKGERQC